LTRTNETEDRIALLLNGLSPRRKTRVLDIGASGRGDASYHELLKAGACEVYGFDAVKDEVSALEAGGATGAKYTHSVLGDGSEQTFYTYERSVFSSLYPVCRSIIDYLERFADGTRLASAQKVQTLRLDDLADLPTIDFVQIDTQGAEVQILSHGRNVLANTVAIVSELRFLRLYEGEPMMARVVSELESQGFVFHRILHVKTVPVPFARSQRVRMDLIASQNVDGDAVFLRDLAMPAKIADEALKHLAILASAVFKSHDIALKCIDILVDRGCVSQELSDAYIDVLPKQFLADEPQRRSRVKRVLNLLSRKG
jgi:FkbM family methyltransferase